MIKAYQGISRQNLTPSAGSFDFLHIMSEADGSAYANINFIDPVFAAWKMLELGMICLPVIFCGDDI